VIEGTKLSEKQRKTFLVNFINRTLNPVVWLKNEREIKDFLKTTREEAEESDFYSTGWESSGLYGKLGLRSRVIGFFHDKKGFGEEF
jgi:hypothetical protein